MTHPILAKVGIKAIDLLILTVALLFITSEAAVFGDFHLLTFDFAGILVIVVFTYFVSVVLVRVFTLWIPVTGWMSRIAKAAISALLVWFLFAEVLRAFFWFLNYGVGVDIQTTLMIATIIRVVVGALLGRAFGGD